MSPERWEQLAAAFEAVRDCAAGDRPRVLLRLCGDDAALRAEVEALLAADAAAADFLTPPSGWDLPGLLEDAAPRLAAGDRLAGRYEILSLLGRGGMGEVYAARDHELGGLVALKLLRPEVAGDARMLDRLKREVLLARRISHPRVCRLHDLAVHAPPGEPPAHLLSMELLEGPTLAERLRDGPAPLPGEALGWLRDIAAGLDAAHAAGVIHRDLKPGNVILSPRGAVITDFGLARPAPAGRPGETASTRALGTPAYMAPEQLAGGPLTPAADIYAFGLLVRALASTRGGRAVGTAGQVGAEGREIPQGGPPPANDEARSRPAGALGGPQPAERQAGRSAKPSGGPRQSTRRPSIDAAWQPVLAGCLHHDPAQRFPSAAAALAAYAPPARRGRRRWLAPAAAALLAVALFTLWLRMSRVEPNVTPGAELLLTPVVNATLDPQLDASTTVLSQQLQQSARFTLTTGDQVRQQLQRMGRPPGAGPASLAQQPALAREVAMRRGAPLVLFATLTRLAGQYRLDLELERVGHDPDAAAGRWTVAETADSKSDLFDALHAGANWVRTLAGEQAAALASTDQVPQDITTASWAALSLYTRALDERVAGRTPQTIALLRQAVALDPQFALAYARLGDFLVEQRSLEQGYDAYAHALRLAQSSHRLSERERLNLTFTSGVDLGDYAGALAAAQAYSALYPDDVRGWDYQGLPQWELGHPDQGRAAWQQALRLVPHNTNALNGLAEMDLWRGDATAAQADARALQSAGIFELAQVIAGSAAVELGRWADADAAWHQLAALPDAYARTQAALLSADSLAERGDVPAARAVLAQGRAASPQDMRADLELADAYLAFQSGLSSQAADDCTAALRDDPSPQVELWAGTLLARSGRAPQAARLAAALRAEHGLQPLARLVAERLDGEVLLARGQPAAALADFQAAARLAGGLDDREYLARGLAAAGRPRDAFAIYSDVADHPGRVWWWAQSHFPGEVADMTLQAVRLATQLHLPAAAPLRARYRALRPTADPGPAPAPPARRGTSPGELP